MTDRGRTRLALLLLAMAGSLPFLPALLRGELYTFGDHLTYFVPLRHYTAEVLRGGALPLWNPYSTSGEAWLANPQTGVFYPPTWLFVVLPFATAYVLFLLVHLVITGWTSYRLFRLEVSREAAMCGAAGLMLAGPTLSLLSVANNLTTFAWIPLVLALAIERARGSDKSAAVDALALTLLFLGAEPFYTLLASAAYAVILLRARRASTLLRVALLAIGFSAVQLMPTAEWLLGSDRAAAFSGATEAVRVADWHRLLVPPATNAHGDTLLLFAYIQLMYCGVLTALAIAGVAVAIVRKRDRRWLWWLALVVAAIVLAGPGAPLVHALRSRYAGRMITIGVLGVAALASIGWDSIRPKRAWVDVVLIAVLAFDVLPKSAQLLRTAPLDAWRSPITAAIGTDRKLVRLPLAHDTRADPLAWRYGYINLLDHRFDVGSGSPAYPPAYARLFEAATSGRRPDLLNALSAGYILCDRPLPLPALARDGVVTLYLNRGAAPMVSATAGQARLVSIDSSSAHVVVDTPRNATVMLSQRDTPGWSATVDGIPQAAPVQRALFRSVAVPAGHHEVVWRYRPASLIAGALLTLATIAFTILRRRSQ